MDDDINGKAKGGIARARKLTAEQKKEIAIKAATARWSATPKANNNNKVVAVKPTKGAAAKQGMLSLVGIYRQIEIDGIGMGVLSDGTAFLTGRGLARLCGVSHRQIQSIAIEWMDENTPTPRVIKIKDNLITKGINSEYPYVAIEQRSGTLLVFPDIVCLAILEYFAFDAAHIKDVAKKNFRLLAGKGLHDFIYTQVGYDPNNTVPDNWRQFHDRVSLTYNSVPKGYFGIFKEMSDMIVTLGQSGLHIDKSFVPDISVGKCWSKFWSDNSLDKKHGERVKYEHNYPDYFPQANSNPQEPWCYPENALGDFRRWLREVYIGDGKFKTYIENKVKEKQLPVSFAQLAIAAYEEE